MLFTRMRTPRFRRLLVLIAVIICVVYFWPGKAYLQRQKSHSWSGVRQSFSHPRMQATNFLSYVHPTIGTEANGHVWVGATVPNGMVKVGVDTDHSEVGYSHKGKIYGISHVHVSGTGGGRSYQNFPFSPHWTFGNDTLPPLNSRLDTLRSNEIARPGFYATTLNSVNVNISLTATNKVGFHQWTTKPMQTFLEKGAMQSDEATVDEIPKKATFHAFFKVAHDSMDSLKARIEFLNGSRLTITGKFKDPWANGLGLGGWDKGNYMLHTCIDFDDQASSFGIWRDSEISGYDVALKTKTTNAREGDSQGKKFVNTLDKNDKGIWSGSLIADSQSVTSGYAMGAYVSYQLDLNDRNTAEQFKVQYRVGISYLSADQACKNLDAQQNVSFEEARKKAESLWEESVSAISASGALDDDDLPLLYTNLYRAFLMPVDKTGENPGWPEKDRLEKPYYDDFYCIWDTFRTLNPLLTLIAPSLEARLLNSLITTAQHTGNLLGDSLVANTWAIVQSGSNADILFSEAIQKDIQNVDYAAAYELLLNQMKNEAPDYLFQGRGNTKAWKEVGYIPATSSNGVASHFHRSSGSRTVEYAYGDFAIGEMAKKMGHIEDAQSFRNSSGNWKNIWNNETENNGFKGFLMPKYEGKFTSLDPAKGCIPGRGGNAEFYEDCSWTYSFYAPQNMKDVIEFMGGDQRFIERLDAFFSLKIYNPGNEPGFLVPFLYHYVGRPDLSTERSIKITDHLFRPTSDGLPGNDDAGTMAALHIFWSLGLFPIAGQDIYLILSPVFEVSSIRLDLPSSSSQTTAPLSPKKEKKEVAKPKYFRIEAKNLTTTNRQVLRATLNGKPLNRAWLRHQEISGGGELVLEMGAEWDGWGSKERPPSFSELGDKSGR
ncbi:glycosyl hydrolase family 92-domain-containing protein, partial [Obelidium mucronatum]